MSELARNIEKLTLSLARFREGGIRNRIGGQDRDGAGGVFQTESPVDRSLICDVARSDAGDVDAAARAAAAAFPAWRDMAATERRRILRNVAAAIEARAEEIALCECWDTGQTLRFMSKAALRGAENFRYFADQAVSARDGQNLPSPTLMNVTTRKPIGPVGVITPWNTPFMLSTWKIAPCRRLGAFHLTPQPKKVVGRTTGKFGSAAAQNDASARFFKQCDLIDRSVRQNPNILAALSLANGQFQRIQRRGSSRQCSLHDCVIVAVGDQERSQRQIGRL